MNLTSHYSAMRFGVFELDLRTSELRKRGVKVKLQDQPFQILAMLLERPGELVTREAIQKRIWPPDTFVDFDLSLNTAVRKLRQGLGDDAETPLYVETIPRRGYRFIAPVEHVGLPPVALEAAGSPVPVEKAAALARPSRWMFGALAAVLAVSVLVYLYWVRSRAAPIDSVAVLPFVNAGGDPNAEYLSDGVTESVIDLLAQVPGLRVVPRNTMFRYKSLDVDPQAVGRELGVRAVVTGRVMQRGARLQIGSELVDIVRQSQVWGEQYNVESDDVMAVQRQIAQAISAKLQMPLTPEDRRRLATRYTQNDASYQLYLKGRFLWNKRTEESVRGSIQDFQQAIERDPRFALAYVGLADSYLILATFTYEPADEAYPKAEQTAVKALQIDDMLAEAHASLAYVRANYDWDWPAAEVEYKRAIQLDPNYVTARAWYAEDLMLAGRQSDALREIRKAQELDPLALIDNVIAAWIFYFTGRYDEAIQEVSKTLELDANFAPTHLVLGEAFEQKGMFEQAIAVLQKAKAEEVGSPLVLAALGHCYAASGKTAEALLVLQEMEDLAKQRYVSPADVALVYAGLNDKDQAIRLLEKAYQERSAWMIFLNVEPRFSNLRSDPRFRSLVQRVGPPFSDNSNK